MRDVELIVRFFALAEASDSYTKPMKQFLNFFMARHQQDNNISEYKDSFLRTTRSVYDNLGARPFHIRRGMSIAATIEPVFSP